MHCGSFAAQLASSLTVFGCADLLSGIWDVLSNQEARRCCHDQFVLLLCQCGVELPCMSRFTLESLAPKQTTTPLPQAVDFVRKRIKADMSLKKICEEMCDHCLAPDLKGLCRGADNMSVTVVLFKKTARLTGFFGRLWQSVLCSFGAKT